MKTTETVFYHDDYSDLSHSLLSQRLLFIDPHIKQDRLHAEEHPVLDLPWQRVEHHAGHWNPDVEAAPVSRDHRQHVRGETGSCLGHFKGDVSQVHHSDAHVLQHGQLLAFMEQAVSTHTSLY